MNLEVIRGFMVVFEVKMALYLFDQAEFVSEPLQFEKYIILKSGV